MERKENLLAYLVGKDGRPNRERYQQARDSFWAYYRRVRARPSSGRTGRILDPANSSFSV